MLERPDYHDKELKTAGYVAIQLGISRERVIELIKEKGLPHERRGKHRSYYVSLPDVNTHVNPNPRRRGWMTNLHGQ